MGDFDFFKFFLLDGLSLEWRSQYEDFQTRGEVCFSLLSFVVWGEG